MRIPISYHLGVATVVLISGCSGDRELPVHPESKVLQNPPTAVTNEYDGTWQATVNGHDLTEPITAEHGEEIVLGLDPTELVRELEVEYPQHGFLIEVRLLPAGASGEDWNTTEFSHVWVLGMNSSPPPHNVTQTSVEVDCEPGVYDARIYLVGINRYEFDNMIELIGETTVTVTQ